MKDYKVRTVKFTISYTFSDKNSDFANMSDEEIFQEAREELAEQLDFRDLSVSNFDSSFTVETNEGEEEYDCFK